MRQIPPAPGAALVAPQPPPVRPDTPGDAFVDAYAQPGISSVAGIPGVRAVIPPPQFGFDERGNRIPIVHTGPVESDPNIVMDATMITGDSIGPQPPVADRTAMMDDARRVFATDREPTWSPICRGTVDQVLMSAGGAHVLIASEHGPRFAAFIPDRPVIELGLRVELGIRHIVDSGTKRSRDVADIMMI